MTENYISDVAFTSASRSSQLPTNSERIAAIASFDLPIPRLSTLRISLLQADTLIWTVRALDLARSHWMGVPVSNNCRLEDLLDSMRRFAVPFSGTMTPNSLEGMADYLHKFEKHVAAFDYEKCDIDRTIYALADRLNLTPSEWSLLRFRIARNTFSIIDQVFNEFFSNITYDKLVSVLAVLFYRPTEEIRSALSPKGYLNQSGLLRLGIRTNYHLDAGLQDRMMIDDEFPFDFQIANGDLNQLAKVFAIAQN